MINKGDPYKLGYETLGSVFLGFLKHLYLTLTASNYSKIFFVSRDGYYMKLIYDILQSQETGLPKSYYLLSSRVMTYSASLIDKESISYIANKDYFPTTLEHLLKIRFNFTEEMFIVSQDNLSKFGFVSFHDAVVQHENHNSFLDFVLFHSSLIIENNKNNKDIFASYIDGLGLDENSLIVDIGYAGSLQKTLLTVTKKKIDGLYFIVNEKIKELNHYDLKYSSYINFDDDIVPDFFKYVQLFELFFSATHPSAVGLKKENDKFKPVFDSTGFSEKTNIILASLHHGAIDFVKEYLEKHRDLFLQLENYDKNVMLHNILNFFKNPSIEDCKLFDEVIFEDNFGANKFRLITNDLDKLNWSDETLASHGIWASASRKLVYNNFYKSIRSSDLYIDKLDDNNLLKPFYQTQEYEKLEKKCISYPFFKIFINMKEEYVSKFIESVKSQFYPFFQVVCYFEQDISDQTKEQLIYTENISFKIGSYNKLNFQDSEWMLFFDNPVVLEPNILVEAYNYITDNNCDILYFDEDDLENGKFVNQKFKPDISPELMLSQPYYCGNAIFVRPKYLSKHTDVKLVISDTIFKSISQKLKIAHLPKILFHNLVTKTNVCYKDLIEEYLQVQNINYREVYQEEFSRTESQPVYSIDFEDIGPEIAIIIPTKNRFDILKVCLDSLELTTYQNYKVYIIDNDSDEDDILEYFKTTKHEVLKISSPNGVFSYSYVNNEAAKMVTEDYVLFLNNDIKVITPHWLSQMAGLMQIEGIGQVGARLYYENDMLQHVGITNHVAPYGLPAPSFKLIAGDSAGYLNYAKSIKNFSAMTAACMLTKKELFFAMGGFDDVDFSVAYNDCDYGFKLTQNGYRNVVAPNAELYHYEGVTRGIGVGNDKPSEESSFIRKYKNWKDPYYNPNLTKSGTDFSLRNTIVRTLPNQKFRCLMISHNYEYEGAPLIQFEIAKGLKEKYNLDVVILSPTDGPLKAAYEENGIETHVLHEFNLFSSHSTSEYEQRLWKIKSQINNIGADVICANTILTYWGVEVAKEFSIPSLWIIHESEPPFEHLRDHSKLIESRGIPCIDYTYKNIFVAYSTKELFEPFNLKNNFEVIHNGFDTSRVTIALDETIRKSMRKELDIEDKFVFICPGIVSKRKSQIDAIKAFELLPHTVKSHVVILIVGDRKSPYSDEMHTYHQNSDDITKQNIKIIGETKEIGKYYNASDAFLFTSHLESFPKVIQEAMYLQLPIVSTNTFGIKEQVFHNSSALLCDIGDIDSLSENVKRVYEDESLREKLVTNALSALEKLPTYEEMVKEYNELMQQAFLLK